MRRRFWSYFTNLVWTFCDPCSFSAIFTWVDDPDYRKCWNQVETTSLDDKNPGILMFLQHVFKYMWPTVQQKSLMMRLPKWHILDWLWGGQDPLGNWGNPSILHGIFFFPAAQVDWWKMAADIPSSFFCLLEEGVEKIQALFLSAHFRGSFHGICHVFASPMPSCASMMRHVEEASWNHFRWIHVNLWNKNAY